MKFIKTTDSGLGTTALLNRLSQELNDGNKVLWLLSGGSAVASETEILKALQKAGITDKLMLMLMDERYGPVDHKDSNWWQLQQAGCDFTKINVIPVMHEPPKPFEQTVAEYSHKIKSAYEMAEVIIGQFGLGPDGHTAGILPQSPATLDSSSQLVIGYHTPEFDRITLTRTALLRVHVGYVFAYGAAKAPALRDLQSGHKSFAELPSLLLRELPEVYVYNDQIGEIT